MAKYDGLIIPRSYNDYINKSDPLGVAQALQLTGVMDAAPTADSNHPVKSSGVYTALAGKQASLTFDNTPTVNSDNPVKSDGIYKAIKLTLEQQVQLAPGANTINLNTNGGYLLLAYGSNYGQGACLITQGYNVAVLKNTLIAKNLNFGQTDYTARKTLTVTNSSSGSISMSVLRIG